MDRTIQIKQGQAAASFPLSPRWRKGEINRDGNSSDEARFVKNYRNYEIRDTGILVSKI